MDSFCGSGSTAHAVLSLNRKDGGKRTFISVEMEKDISEKVAAPRIERVIKGYRAQSKSSEIVFQRKLGIRDLQNADTVLSELNELRDEKKTEFDEVKASLDDGLLTLTGIRDVSEDIPGLGGGFRYCRLGTPLFNEFGDIDGGVIFPDLAAHVYFSETGSPLPHKVDGSTHFIGTHREKAVYLLFSPAEQGFAREASGNVLTPDTLANLPAPSNDFAGVRVVYAEGCTVSTERLKAEGVIFKQIPYQIEGN